MAKKMKCFGYKECSAKTMEGVQSVFELAMKAVICPKLCEQKSQCRMLEHSNQRKVHKRRQLIEPNSRVDEGRLVAQNN